MHVSLKTSVIVAAIALLLAAPSTKADPFNISHCFQDYRACIASGSDPDSCRDEYYYCRFG
ncbi:MAG: hypothetical protein IT473_09320 [Lysobacter sp.]|nr:hypothetical protein [Lysobacter sp.]